MGGVSLPGLRELFLQLGGLPFQRVEFGEHRADARDAAAGFEKRERWQRVIAEFPLAAAKEVRLQLACAAKFVE
jgi:hypothetical protein